MNSAPAVLIVGAGWIGRQVGLRMAICGLNVFLADRSPAALQSASQWMDESAETYVAAIAGEPPTDDTPVSSQPMCSPALAQSWRERIAFGQADGCLSNSVSVVLECISEQMALKRRTLRDLSQQFSKDTILASNSSYFIPSQFAAYLTHPERFAHWHFHVPLHRSSIADVMGHPGTAPWVVDRLVHMSHQIHQYPLQLRHEQPGYVFNWLLQSVLRSALELAARDVADVADIDRAWKAVSGMPIGPFAMMDNIGLDVIEQVLANARWDTAAAVPIEQLLAVLRRPIGRGDLGVKTGRGFYEHE